MSEQPDGEGQEQQWPPPGEVAALEPGTEPSHPLRAQDVAALMPKEIG